MARAYWKRVHKEAFAEACQQLGVRSRGDFMLRLALAMSVILVLLFLGTEDAARDEILIRAALVILIILLFPVVYTWKFLSVPPRLHIDTLRKAARERIHRRELQSRIDSAQPRPDLTGRVEQTIVGDGDNAQPDSVLVFLFIMIENAGTMQSIARDFLISIECGDQTYLNPPTHLPGSINLRLDDDRWTELDSTEAMYIKTEKPIPVGGMTRGFLAAFFPKEIKDYFGGKIMVTIEFSDVQNNKYQISEEISAAADRAMRFNPLLKRGGPIEVTKDESPSPQSPPSPGEGTPPKTHRD